MKTLIFILLFALPAFAQTETDLLKLDNLKLRMELMARDFRDIKAEADALEAKIKADMAKAQAEKKDEKTKVK